MSTAPHHRHFHDELQQLKEQLLEMSNRVERLLDQAMTALLRGDRALAREVIEQDAPINRLEIEIDETCVGLIARHQPVARDLRFITMAMKISNDLERVGDHAVNIAEAAERLGELPWPGVLSTLGEMTRIARGMLSDALNAFVRDDSKLARDVCIRDDRVDALDETVFRLLVSHMMEVPSTIGPSIQLLLVSRNLERVADLATNLGEDVVYLVEGRSIKHHIEEIEPEHRREN
jgi:phosphate transport system protein